MSGRSRKGQGGDPISERADSESYMVFPAALEDDDGTVVPAPPQDAEESRATTQRPVMSTVPTLIQRLGEMITSLRNHHDLVIQGHLSPNAWHSCQEAELLLDVASQCEGTDQLCDELATILEQLERLLQRKPREKESPMQRFTLACVQMASRPMATAENTERAMDLTAHAVKETGAQLVVLPETVTTGFTPDCGAEELWDRVEDFDGPLARKVGGTAKSLGIHLTLPAYERGPERGVVYNSVALFGPDGALLGRYRKTHLFPTERLKAGGWSTPGTEPVVVRTSLGDIGLTICYDGDFPELYRCEAVMGAEIILRPSALLRSCSIWELTNRARAYDNHVYIAACNAVGPDAGDHYYFGHSMIVSPIAQVIALARGTDGDIAVAELDPDPIKRVSWGSPAPMIFDHLQDRNLEAYREKVLQPAHSRFEPARRVET